MLKQSEVIEAYETDGKVVCPNCGKESKTGYSIREEDAKGTVINTYNCNKCNSRWSLYWQLARYDNVVNGEEVLKRREKANKEMDAYELKINQFDTEAESTSLSTEWSIFEIDSLHDTHPYKEFNTLYYSTHWGEGIVNSPIEGATYLDMYVAADNCIKLSKDEHHIFIESFYEQEGELYLRTGS